MIYVSELKNYNGFSYDSEEENKGNGYVKNDFFKERDMVWALYLYEGEDEEQAKFYLGEILRINLEHSTVTVAWVDFPGDSDDVPEFYILPMEPMYGREVFTFLSDLFSK